MTKTAIDVFRDILEKDKLERNDLELLIDKILVFEDHLEIRLQSDIDTLLRCGTLPAETEDAANFNQGTENIETTLIQSSKNHEVFRVNVISNGDPLEIFTDREGEVILKKYSPIGELGDFAKEYAESLQLALGMTAAVCDKDTVIAASGPCRKELIDKPIHSDLEELMDRRGRLCVGADGGTAPHITADGAQPFAAAAIATIICAGDPIGAVMLLSRDENASIGRAEQKATETAANFLGKQMEG